MNTINFNTFEQSEYKAHLEETFINPLNDLGFSLVATNSFGPDDKGNHNYYGNHTLILEHDNKTAYTDDQIQKLMIDDDSQPFSTFQLYLGTLWVFIPYTI